MQVEGVARSGLDRFGFWTLMAALALIVAAMLPAGAGATLIEPHGSTHSVNTHAATSPPSPSPAPTPAPAPQASSQTVPPSLPPAPSQASSPSSGHRLGARPPQESDFPGPSIPGGESDPPFPEGLPTHSDPDCDLDCKQEWYEWFDARATAAWVESQAGGTKEEKDAAHELRQETNQIETEIKQEGGTPGEWSDPPEPVITSEAPSASQSSPSYDGASTSPTEAVIDAITGVGPLATDDLGSFDLSGVANVADLVSLGGPIRALAQLAGIGDGAGAVQVADLGSLAVDEEEGDLGAFLISFAAKVKAAEAELALQSILSNIPFVGDAHACPKGSYQSLNDQKDDPHAATFACY